MYTHTLHLCKYHRNKNRTLDPLKVEFEVGRNQTQVHRKSRKCQLLSHHPGPYTLYFNEEFSFVGWETTQRGTACLSYTDQFQDHRALSLRVRDVAQW